MHKIIKFNCEKCEFETNDKRSSKAHMKIVHNVATFSCTVDDSESEFTCNSNLKRYKHIKVTCDKCEFEAHCKRKLKVHMKGVHEMSLLKCD